MNPLHSIATEPITHYKLPSLKRSLRNPHV